MHSGLCSGLKTPPTKCDMMQKYASSCVVSSTPIYQSYIPAGLCNFKRYLLSYQWYMSVLYEDLLCYNDQVEGYVK